MESNMYKSRLVVLPLLVSLAACGGENAESSFQPAVQKQAVSPADPAAPPAGAREYLPAHVKFAFKHAIRTNRVITDKDGNPRRRSIIDFFEGDPVTVAEQIRSALTAEGYRFIDASPAPHDANRMRFHKPGEGMVIASVYPRADGKAAEGAIGTVVVEYK